MLCTKHIIVFSLENSFPIVLSGEVYTEPTARALYLTRQHYMRTVTPGVDNNRIICLEPFIIVKRTFKGKVHTVFKIMTTDAGRGFQWKSCKSTFSELYVCLSVL